MGDHLVIRGIACIYETPPSRNRCEWSILFKLSLTGFNSEFYFRLTSWNTKIKELSLPKYLPITGGKIVGCIPSYYLLFRMTTTVTSLTISNLKPLSQTKQSLENKSFLYENIPTYISTKCWSSLLIRCLSDISLGRSSRLNPVSVQSWSMQVFAGRPTLVCPCVVVHKETLLMCSTLCVQQCPTYPIRHTSVFVRWEASSCTAIFFFFRLCLQDLFKTVRSILVLLISSFFLQKKKINYIQTTLYNHLVYNSVLFAY